MLKNISKEKISLLIQENILLKKVNLPHDESLLLSFLPPPSIPPKHQSFLSKISNFVDIEYGEMGSVRLRSSIHEVASTMEKIGYNYKYSVSFIEEYEEALVRHSIKQQKKAK